MREFSVLIRREPDLEGQWVAHCLNWDLVSQGDAPAHAVKMIIEAVVLTIGEDSKDGLDPDDRPAAPSDLWELFSSTQHNGTCISAADVDTLVAQSGTVVIAAVLHLERGDELASVPPPFMIATLGDDQTHA